MKNYIRWLWVWCALASLKNFAEETIIERGPHHNLVQTTKVVELGGKSLIQTGQYVELGSGKNFWDTEQKAWLPSTDEIEIVETGAIYRKGPYSLRFAADINDANGALEWKPNPEQRIVIQTIGIAISEEESGDSVWIGQVKNAQGFLTARNEVTYPACFEGIDADVRISVSPSGFENDVVLRESVANPGFAGTARLDIWHHILSGPAPEERPVGFRRSVNKTEIDTQLGFGAMLIGPGNAFLLGQAPKAISGPEGRPIRVIKEYYVDPESREAYLIESVPLSEAAPHLRTLPPSQHALKLDALQKGRLQAARSNGKNRRLPIAIAERPRSKEKMVAALIRRDFPARPGLLMDFTTLVTVSSKVLKGDTTYVVATNTMVNLSGTTVLEPGCVIKFGTYNPTNGTPIINILGPLDCQTRPFLPAVFTSREDRTVGETNAAQLASIATNAYGAYHLCFIQTNNNAIALHDIRSRYAMNAFGFMGTNTVDAYNIQVVSAQSNVFEGKGNTITLRNILAHNVKDLAVASANNTVFKGEHLTIHSASKAFSAGSFTGCSFNLTNSILAVVTNTSSSGLATAFTAEYTNDTGIFQTVGAGAHYLAEGSTNRNAGTANISFTLRDIVFRYSTTYPPIVLTNSFVMATTLAPQAVRDRDIPDRGYHYPALDWAIGGLTLSSGVTLTLTNGVAIGLYNSTPLNTSAGALVSEGRPLALNKLVRYDVVQEQPYLWGSLPSTLLYAGSSTPWLRLTELTALGGEPGRNLSLSGGITLRDSELLNLSFSADGYGSTIHVGLTNNLFQRCALTFEQGRGEEDAPLPALAIDLYNNLFRLSALSVNYYGTSSYFYILDNLFDNTTVTEGGTTPVANAYNAYINTTALASSWAGDVTISDPADYQIGLQGSYYYQTSGTKLHTLRDAGSRSVASAGLYHYTIRTDHTKDTSNIAIGYHYPAVDANGVPTDDDGDGIPDYLEDRNGNGSLDAGETDWTTGFLLNTGPTGLLRFTPLE